MMPDQKYPDPKIPVAMIRGDLFDSPEVKESAKGNPYVRVSIKMDTGGFMKLMIMDENLMNDILELRTGATIIAKGQVTVGVYNNRPSMTMFPTKISVVEGLDLDMGDAPPKRKKNNRPPTDERPPVSDERVERVDPSTGEIKQQEEFDDEIPF